MAHAQSSRSSNGHFSGRNKIENELMSLFSFNNFLLLNIIISMLASCQMQLALTTSLQLVIYARKQTTKPRLLTSPWPTKIVNIFLKGSSASVKQEAAHILKEQ